MEIRRGAELLLSCHGCRYKKKRKKSSSTVPSGFFVDAQRIMFSVDLVNSYFCSPPIPALSFCSSSEVKQKVMYCILYDFFLLFFKVFQRVTVSWSKGWEGNKLQLYYFYFYTEEKEAKCNFCSLCRFLVNFSFHSM